MTPEQVRELREAAETEMKFSAEACPPDHPLCKFYEVVRLRHRMLAQYVLTTVHADDALPVTADWLREYGFTTLDGMAWHHKQMTGTFCFENNALSWWHTGNKTATIHNRHQFRQLAGILGIQPKK